MISFEIVLLISWPRPILSCQSVTCDKAYVFPCPRLICILSTRFTRTVNLFGIKRVRAVMQDSAGHLWTRKTLIHFCFSGRQYLHNSSLQPFIQHYDLASHTTYTVCVNFIYNWWDLQFKVDSGFWESFHSNLYLLSEFLLEICWEEVAEEIFFFIIRFGRDAWPGFYSANALPTRLRRLAAIARSILDSGWFSLGNGRPPGRINCRITICLNGNWELYLRGDLPPNLLVVTYVSATEGKLLRIGER